MLQLRYVAATATTLNGMSFAIDFITQQGYVGFIGSKVME